MFLGGLPWWLSGKGSACQWETQVWSLGGKIPWWRKWQPTPVFLPGKSHRQISLGGYRSWCCKRVRCNLRTKQQQQCVTKACRKFSRVKVKGCKVMETQTLIPVKKKACGRQRSLSSFPSIRRTMLFPSLSILKVPWSAVGLLALSDIVISVFECLPSGLKQETFLWEKCFWTAQCLLMSHLSAWSGHKHFKRI